MSITPNYSEKTTQNNFYVLPVELTAQSSAEVWLDISRLLSSNQDKTISIDASNLQYCDESGLALLFQIRNYPRKTNAKIELSSLSSEIEALYISLTNNLSLDSSVSEPPLSFIESIGKWLNTLLNSAKESMVFLGRCVASLAQVCIHPSRLRAKEVLDVANEAGTNAVGIVCLIGFLMGVIIAFETALVAQIFGAVIFVVNGIGVAMTRELGPLMTAILFAGRSGAAFAAQLGTQKVNEEMNALITFGLDPIHFLVRPRLIASVLVVPLLAILADLVGIIGGGLVMGLYGITFSQFYTQLLGAVHSIDIIVGLVKAAIFGFVIALIGCQCGMNTGAGASAVGISTTKAVVSGIVWIVLIDGIAAVLLNRLGL